MADITLTQHLLGMRPYVLIEAFDGGEGEDDLRLAVSMGGGAQEDLSALPFLLLGQIKDNNPLTGAVSEQLAEHPDDRAALARFADLIGFPMPEGS